MAAINPSIDQAYLLTFQQNFEKLAQQKDTKILNTPAIKFLDIKGISNVSRLDKIELEEVTGTRNPEKNYTEMSNDNRKSVASRFAKTILIDDYDKAVQLITDPTSDLFQMLHYAKNRTTDRAIAKAAAGNVLVGKPDAPGTILTPAQDGVVTIDGTTGFDYENVISKAITKFENNEIDCSVGTTLAISATEKEELRNDDRYMNAFYSNQNTVDKGNIVNASGFNVVSFAGSTQGGGTVDMPVLPETNGERTNILMSPQSIAFGYEVGRLDCVKSGNHINSWEIIIDYWIKAVRIEGARVILLSSLIK